MLGRGIPFSRAKTPPVFLGGGGDRPGGARWARTMRRSTSRQGSLSQPATAGSGAEDFVRLAGSYARRIRGRNFRTVPFPPSFSGTVHYFHLSFL